MNARGHKWTHARFFGQLQQYATLMGISESELATDLLKTIVQDDLCNAVLDRDAAEVAKAA